MAHILVVEDDPIFTALLSDRLELAGHRVEMVAEGSSAVASVSRQPPDLVILKLTPPAVAGIVLVRALRSRCESPGAPILVLAPPIGTVERLALLRAGADEVLNLPVDPEELLLRTERLLGIRRAETPALSGDLSRHPIWELLQYLDHAGKSGQLVIHGKLGSGRLGLIRGQVAEARWERLEGAEALLAFLDQQEGQFNFLAGIEKAAPPRGERIDSRRLLLEAGWLRDELERRRDLLPATGAPLQWIGDDSIPEIDEPTEIPLAKVAERIRRRGPVRLFDLLAEQIAAPSKVRLAVAMLIEQRKVQSEILAGEPIPSTTEIHGSILLDLTVSRLLASARKAGLEVTPLPFLVLVEPGAWGPFRKAVERLPGTDQVEALRQLHEKLRWHRGANTVLHTQEGDLYLHVQVLTDAIVRQLGAIIPVCAGMIVWLEEGAGADGLEGLATRLGSVSPRGSTVFIAPSKLARQRLETLAPKTPIKISSEPPQSLLGLLRLFQPGRGGGKVTPPPGAEPEARPPSPPSP